MGESKSFVYLDVDQYEELVSRSAQLARLERAYRSMESYELGRFVKVIFGEPTAIDGQE